MIVLNLPGNEYIQIKKCRLGSLYRWFTAGILLFFIVSVYLLVQINYRDVRTVHSHRQDVLIQFRDIDNEIHAHLEINDVFGIKNQLHDDKKMDYDNSINNNSKDQTTDVSDRKYKDGKLNSIKDEADEHGLYDNVTEMADLAERLPGDKGVFNYGPLYKVPGEGRNTTLTHVELAKRMNRIRDSMRTSWARYKKCAWGFDKLHPDTCHGSTWFGLGLTIIDSLDTLFIMGLKEELAEARGFIETLNLRDGGSNVNIFEITIRVLGALLSMYNFTYDQLYINTAVDLGNILLASGAFNTSSGVPLSDIDLSTGMSHQPTCPGCSSHSSLSESTTIQLEFNELTRLTNDPKFKAATDRVMFKIIDKLPPGGLPSVYVDVNTGVTSGVVTLGARGDSYYEYLLKQWIQTKNTRFRDKYLEAMKTINDKLVFSSFRNLTYVAEILKGKKISHKMDHLVCFLPGTLALGTLYGAPRWHLTLAESIIRTCVEMYNTRSGLAPEIVKFDMRKYALFIYPHDEFSLLRPETVESLFILWRVTHKPVYRHWAWDIYSSIERHAKHPVYGYSSMDKINKAEAGRKNSLESFFLAETLKYLYLIHEPDDILPLSRYVFNTEAHPFALGRFYT